MDMWREIRLHARRRREEAEDGAPITDTGNLLAAARKKAGLQLDHFEPGTVYGEGVVGALVREDGFLRVVSKLHPEEEAIVQGHELGHFYLHDESQVVETTEPTFGGQPFETGVDRVVAYSPRERREVQADIFAQEFLLPADRLRERFVQHRQRPSDIAKDVGLPPAFVLMQTARSVLLPPLRPPAASKPTDPSPPPDKDQRIAAEWAGGPLMVDAGPGTGKTKTLIARIEHLLSQQVPPTDILALTFSNKAAAEMMERVERLNPTAAPLLWIGTFHAFGLEMLHLHGDQVGIGTDFEIIDETEALAVLEDMLGDLPLKHYQNLWDPGLELRPVLRAISRAKDEMIEPAEYLQAAKATRGNALTDEQIERADKAIEVGEVYALYQKALRDRKRLDFGDLVAFTVKLLRESPLVQKELRERYNHILIDEYQDVNFASTQLVKALSEAGEGLWVVADPRQSIYRFRGASPSSVLNFTSDYQGAKRQPLGTNYRSGRAVVSLFQQFGAGIAAAPKPAATWHPHRGEVGFVEYLHAPDLASEAAGIGEQIIRLTKQGIPFRNQALLARTHLTLARLAQHLESDDIPILYLGDLFERPEIRDLLALISIDAEPGGVGLVRVAQFPEYGATYSDALIVIAEAVSTGDAVLVVCDRATSLQGITPAGGVGLKRLADQLRDVGPATSAWRLLSTYLFEKSSYLFPLVDAGTIQSQQALIAIYQLLKFSREHQDGRAGLGERRHFLDTIRRLERLDDDRAFRVVPPEADDIEAVRFMTIHGSKGLEFDAVHLPFIATNYMPGGRRPVLCPAPVGLERLEISQDEHSAEEECLFFVALSRARDVLTISRADRYTPGRWCNASKYLANLGAALPAPRRLTAKSGSES